jgi:hypothetical protein
MKRMDLLQLLVDAEAEESSSSGKIAAVDTATDTGEDADTEKMAAANSHQSSGNKMRLSSEVRCAT